MYSYMWTWKWWWNVVSVGEEQSTKHYQNTIVAFEAVRGKKSGNFIYEIKCEPCYIILPVINLHVD